MSGKTFESEHDRSDVRAVRRNPWVMALAMLPLLLTLIPMWIGAFIDSQAFLFVLHPLILGVMALFYAFQRNPWARIEDARVRANEESLWVDGERVARDEITAGVMVPGRHSRVHIERGRRQRVELEVEDDATGRALLDALGLSESQTVATFRTASRAMAGGWRLFGFSLAGALGMLTLAGVLSMIHPVAGAAGLVTGALGLAGLFIWPARVDVGIDGVLVRWLGRERFISHASIEGAAVATQHAGRSRLYVVDLLLQDGESYRIPVSQTFWDFGRATRLHQRIMDARAAYRRGAPADDAALLKRGSRSHLDWVRALKVSEARSNLRRAPLRPETLWRIVEDASGDALERAAAATALSGEMDRGERKRLQRVAGATAAPRLRIALDAVADDDEQALAEAMAELEGDSRRSSA